MMIKGGNRDTDDIVLSLSSLQLILKVLGKTVGLIHLFIILSELLHSQTLYLPTQSSLETNRDTYLFRTSLCAFQRI